MKSFRNMGPILRLLPNLRPEILVEQAALIVEGAGTSIRAELVS